MEEVLANTMPGVQFGWIWSLYCILFGSFRSDGQMCISTATETASLRWQADEADADAVAMAAAGWEAGANGRCLRRDWLQLRAGLLSCANTDEDTHTQRLICSIKSLTIELPGLLTGRLCLRQANDLLHVCMGQRPTPLLNAPCSQITVDTVWALMRSEIRILCVGSTSWICFSSYHCRHLNHTHRSIVSGLLERFKVFWGSV